MNAMNSSDLLQYATELAKDYRDAVVRGSTEYEPCVKVELTVIGPDNVTRVPCGDATFTRCEADVFSGGILTITARDNGWVMREYQPGQWTSATVYNTSGDIDYCILPKE